MIEATQMETILGIAERYQTAMRRVNKLIGDKQKEIQQRINNKTSTPADLELVEFIQELLLCLKLD